MKNYQVVSTREIQIDGETIPAGELIAVMRSSVSPMTLFGLMQFHGAELGEVNDEMEDVIEGESDTNADSQADSDTASDEPSEESGSGEESDPTVQPGPSDTPSTTPTSLEQFVAAGLDEGTAQALITNNLLSADDVREYVSKGGKLVELEDIGKTRAKRIEEAFQL